jgi:uncharacterized protein YqhQ
MNIAQNLAQNLGGQALPEGVLVRSPSRWAVAVRRTDGSVHVEAHEGDQRWPRLRKTFLRGPLALAEAVAIGMRGINVALREGSGTEVGKDAMTMVFVPVAVGVLGLFVAVPGMLTAGLADRTADVVEAAARAVMLVIYLLALSRSEQSKRLFGYHGAEHMAIAACERHDRVPTKDEAGAESPVHVRCGTDFIALFVVGCGIVFAFVTRHSVWLGGVLRVALVPAVAALAYEVMRLCARYPRRPWARLGTWPGRALQRITTRRPDDGQLEVALLALSAALS